MANESAGPTEAKTSDPYVTRLHTQIQAHPVKVERHDTQAGVHHTNTGARPVDLYREHARGLYVSRRFVAHPRVSYWQAHLLPDLLPGGLGIQLCHYDFHGERAHDFYIDVASISRQDHVWTVRDHYLDLLVWNGLSAEIADTDELSAALTAGHVSAHEFAAAVTGAHTLLNGLARCGYDVRAWLESQGLNLAWNMVDHSAPCDPCDPCETVSMALA
jgi:predicted RNA-binding protein associated with RNAse of E/G family